jgi:hypothetical protein
MSIYVCTVFLKKENHETKITSTITLQAQRPPPTTAYCRQDIFFLQSADYKEKKMITQSHQIHTRKDGGGWNVHRWRVAEGLEPRIHDLFRPPSPDADVQLHDVSSLLCAGYCTLSSLRAASNKVYILTS